MPESCLCGLLIDVHVQAPKLLIMTWQIIMTESHNRLSLLAHTKTVIRYPIPMSIESALDATINIYADSIIATHRFSCHINQSDRARPGNRSDDFLFHVHYGGRNSGHLRLTAYEAIKKTNRTSESIHTKLARIKRHGVALDCISILKTNFFPKTISRLVCAAPSLTNQCQCLRCFGRSFIAELRHRQPLGHSLV